LVAEVRKSQRNAALTLEAEVARRTRELANTAARLSLSEQAGRSFVYELDVAADRVWCGEGFEPLLGLELGEVPQTLSGWGALLQPADHAHAGADGVTPILDEEERCSIQQRVRHKAGRYIWVWDRGRVIRDSVGAIVRLIGTKTDIAERKQLEARQMPLTSKLAHRVKNSFALLLSAMRATLRSSPDPKSFAASFAGRVTRLAKAQDILTQAHEKSTDLRHFAGSQLAAFTSAHSRQISIEGPTVRLPAAIIVP
jgi:HWE histidine kinase/PAS fold